MASMLKDELIADRAIKRALLYASVWIVSLAYSWRYAERFLYGDFQLEYKPFIFRQFSIQAVNFLEYFTGLKYGYAACLFVGLMSIAFAASVLLLIEETRPDIKQKEIFTLLIFCLFCIAFQTEMKPADIATAFFFTLALCFLIREDFYNYLLVFLVSSIHRETTILLLLVYIAYCSRYGVGRFWSILLIQLISFFLIQYLIRFIFQDAPGQAIWYSFYDNLKTYSNHVIATFVYFCSFILLLVAVTHQWVYKNRLLKIAFMQIFSTIFICFILFGQPFEFRVFAEVFSITAILLVPEI